MLPTVLGLSRSNTVTEITTIQDIAQLSVHDYYIVVEREPTPTIHVIALPDDIKGGQYWQLRSLQSSHKRALTHWSNRYYNASDFGRVHLRFSNSCEFMNIQYAVEHEHKMYSLHKIVVHESVWQYYKNIGFDYKNKAVKHLEEVFIIFDK